MTTEAELLANLPADGVRVWRSVTDSTWIRAVLPDGEHWFTRGGAAWVECQWACNSSDPQSSPDWTEITPAPAPSLRDQRIAEAWERWPKGRLFERGFSDFPHTILRMTVGGKVVATHDGGPEEWNSDSGIIQDADYYERTGFTEIPRPTATPTPTLPNPSGDLPDGTRVRVTLTYEARKNGSMHILDTGDVVNFTDFPDGTEIATIEVLALPTPPPSALDGKPGSLWRDPMFNTTWARVRIPECNVMFRQVSGIRTEFEGQLLSGYGNGDNNTIARLVPAEVTA